MVPTSSPSSLLEENLGRVIDSVVRNVSAGRGAVPDPDAMEAGVGADGENEARETLADLCGHVTFALKSMDAQPHALATYRAPEAPATAPTLNLVR
ncbi:MAG TPA: hypothetical protein VII66_09685 [Gemmatimonadaceae bacterium]